MAGANHFTAIEAHCLMAKSPLVNGSRGLASRLPTLQAPCDQNVTALRSRLKEINLTDGKHGTKTHQTYDRTFGPVLWHLQVQRFGSLRAQSVAPGGSERIQYY